MLMDQEERWMVTDAQVQAVPSVRPPESLYSRLFKRALLISGEQKIRTDWFTNEVPEELNIIPNVE